MQRTRRLAVASVGALIVAFSAAVAPTSAATSPTASMHTEIVDAFGHLVGPPQSATALGPFVQGVDAAMATALAKGAVDRQGNPSYLLPDGSMHVSAVRGLSSSEASVTFAVADSGYGSSRFVGTAVDAGGRWKVSWVTACTLVEQEGVLCPNPPAGVTAALPLPTSLTGEQEAVANSPDLVRPGTLALAHDGDLFVVDTDRNQILEWRPNGTLSVFAGTGDPGFSGDGGPAVDAEIDDLGGMALGSDGTLYFVASNRVRAVSPAGIITTVAGNGKSGTSGDGGPAVDASLEPSDVAVSGHTLYIATGQAIREVSATGVITTFFQGPLSDGEVSTGQGEMGFDPQNIAFDGAGNLIVFNGGPREMFSISPAGKLTDLGEAYEYQLTTAPNGEVYGAGHGETVDRVTATGVSSYLNLMPLKIAGLWFPGDQTGLEPNGIAVAPSGVIYLDSFNGNGWSGGTSLVEITAKGTARALPIHTPVLATLPAPGAAGFPSSIYPRSSKATGSDLTACPSSAGLEPFDATATAAAKASAAKFNAFTSSLYGDLRSSDRSWWSSVFSEWVGADYNADNHTVLSVQPAAEDTFAAAVAHACGSRLVQESLVVDVGPSAYSSQVSHLYFLDRGGRPLIYFQAT